MGFLFLGSDEQPTEKEITQALSPSEAKAISPYFIKPGTGGKIVRTREGRTIGPIGGELLRLALARGGEILGEKPIEVFQRR
jgi:hypothetical protein